MRRAFALFVLGAAAMVAVPALAQDNLDGPWATPFGNMYGTCSSTEIPVLFEPGGEVEIAWTFDTLGAGLEPPALAAQITFDSEGNLYWHSPSVGENDYIVSVTPQGTLRWYGPPEGLGYWQTESTPLVGNERVYIVGTFPTDDPANSGDPPIEVAQYVYAVNKSDGSLAWRAWMNNEPAYTEPPVPSYNAQPNAMLYNGTLFVVGKPGPEGAAVYQIDAATGTIEGNARISQIQNTMIGNTLLIPDKFGPGIHGLYVVTYEAYPSQVFGIKVDTNTHTSSYVWETSSEPGLGLGDLTWYSYGHIFYSQQLDLIYAYNENDMFGYEVYAMNPTDGFMGWPGDSGDEGDKGWYQTGCLGFDGATVYTGSWDGGFLKYVDDGFGNLTYVSVLRHALWDHPRQIIQLLQADNGHTIAVTGSSGIGTGMAHALMIDLDGDPNEIPAPDGPTYIDDIEVWQGPDPNNLTLVWSDDFEGYAADSPPGGGWETIYGPPQSSPLIKDDPTGEGNGNVLELDAAQAYDPDWTGHGVYHAYAQTTANVIVTKYRQYREDTSDTYEIMWGANADDYTRGYAYAWDWDRRLTTLDWEEAWNQPNFQIDRRWEDVTYTYDYAAQTSTVQVADRDPVTTTWDPGWDYTPQAKPAGIGFFLWHTDAGEKYTRVWVNELIGVRQSWLDVDLHGGPIVGPDGKMYFFAAHNDSAECNGCLYALQPKSPAPPGCPGDYDCSGAIDFFDIDLLLAALGGEQSWSDKYQQKFGTTPPCGYLANCDANTDGTVDFFDIDAFLGLLGTSCP